MVAVSLKGNDGHSCRQDGLLILLRALIAPLLRPAGHEEHGEPPGEFLRIQEDSAVVRLLVADGQAAGEDARPPEQLRMGKDASLGLHAAHGKPCHGPVLLVGNRPVSPVDKGNPAAHQFLRKGAHGRMICPAVRERISCSHDHNHLFHPSRGNEIVRQIGQLPLPDPSRLVLSAAMLEIEHRVSAVRLLLVGGRGVHIAQLRAPGLL